MTGTSLTPVKLALVATLAVVVVAGLLVAAMLVLKPQGQASPTTTTGNATTSFAKTFYVQISCGQVSVCTNGFYPKNLTIPAGSRVTWYSDEPPELYIYHNVVFRVGGMVSGQLNGGDEFTVTFSTPGVYQYYDADFPGNQGVITVLASK